MQNIIIVTRHPASKDWIIQNLSQNLHMDINNTNVILQDRADFSFLNPGDIVVGVLPIKMVSYICKQNVSFFALDINVPDELRGQELTKEMLLNCNPTLQKYTVTEG